MQMGELPVSRLQINTLQSNMEKKQTASLHRRIIINGSILERRVHQMRTLSHTAIAPRGYVREGCGICLKKTEARSIWIPRWVLREIPQTAPNLEGVDTTRYVDTGRETRKRRYRTPHRSIRKIVRFSHSWFNREKG
ncbi:MAG: hypothetical protein MASP_01790 [Candidatus Methanolliviera sp. GoM_asphalt]|nr:MAG: hypothetical protein MASP_01790 [Candidatus Methanolliviera sp. GoM_asphalt]